MCIATLNKLKAQTIERTFEGYWARTSWSYEFKQDGSYIRTSSGHFGSPIFKGEYSITSDTLIILNGHKESSGTLNSKHLIVSDTFLIDLTNFYDYLSSTRTSYYNSKKRYDILSKPNMDSMVTIELVEFKKKVQESTKLLETKKVRELSDEQNIQIIRLTNTLRMNQNSLIRKEEYKEFEELIVRSNYANKISTSYDWIQNRGMGFYFQKLQIELGGTPHLWSVYVIK